MTAIFPTLPTGFSRHRKILVSSRRAPHTSGREVVLALQAIPRFAFELLCEGLSAGAAYGGLPADSKQAQEAFFANQLGPATPFLYQDPEDYQATAYPIGTGDGATKAFTFLWPWGSIAVPVGQVNNAAAINVYQGGSVVASSAYSITLPNTLTFTTAPAAGVAITADYQFYFLCRFDDDNLDFENFMYLLWSVGSIKFTSIKP